MQKGLYMYRYICLIIASKIYKPQDKDKQNNTTQKTKKISNTHPTTNIILYEMETLICERNVRCLKECRLNNFNFLIKCPGTKTAGYSKF